MQIHSRTLPFSCTITSSDFLPGNGILFLMQPFWIFLMQPFWIFHFLHIGLFHFIVPLLLSLSRQISKIQYCAAYFPWQASLLIILPFVNTMFLHYSRITRKTWQEKIILRSRIYLKLPISFINFRELIFQLFIFCELFDTVLIILHYQPCI